MEIEKLAEAITELRVETEAMGDESLIEIVSAFSDMAILGAVAKEKGEDLLYTLIKEKLSSIVKDFKHSLDVAGLEKDYKSLERELNKLKSVEEKIKRDALLSKKDLSYMLDVSLPQVDIWLRELYNPIPSIQLKEGGNVKFRWCDVVAWVDANNIR
ncbi:hypothetical protein C9925_00865 [cyanobacterium G8-9]|nr:hypothetical protein C9925_00865 [cyanobacterium G8-9]